MFEGLFTPTALDEESVAQRWWEGSANFDFSKEERRIERAQRFLKPPQRVEVQGLANDDVGGRRFCATGGDWQNARLLAVQGARARVEHQDVFENELSGERLVEWVPLHTLRPQLPARYAFRWESADDPGEEALALTARARAAVAEAAAAAAAAGAGGAATAAAAAAAASEAAAEAECLLPPPVPGDLVEAQLADADGELTIWWLCVVSRVRPDSKNPYRVARVDDPSDARSVRRAQVRPALCWRDADRWARRAEPTHSPPQSGDDEEEEAGGGGGGGVAQPLRQLRQLQRMAGRLAAAAGPYDKAALLPVEVEGNPLEDAGGVSFSAGGGDWQRALLVELVGPAEIILGADDGGGAGAGAGAGPSAPPSAAAVAGLRALIQHRDVKDDRGKWLRETVPLSSVRPAQPEELCAVVVPAEAPVADADVFDPDGDDAQDDAEMQDAAAAEAEAAENTDGGKGWWRPAIAAGEAVDARLPDEDGDASVWWCTVVREVRLVSEGMATTATIREEGGGGGGGGGGLEMGCDGDEFGAGYAELAPARAKRGDAGAAAAAALWRVRVSRVEAPEELVWLPLAETRPSKLWRGGDRWATAAGRVERRRELLAGDAVWRRMLSVQHAAEQTARSSTSKKFKSPKQASTPSARTAAVLRGLRFVFALAQDESSFASFGSDIVQTFYDVATVGSEPVRHQALKYVEVTAQWWKARNSADVGGGAAAKAAAAAAAAAAAGEGGGTAEAKAAAAAAVAAVEVALPPPKKKSNGAAVENLLDVVPGIYALERLGIEHALKAQLARRVAAEHGALRREAFGSLGGSSSGLGGSGGGTLSRTREAGYVYSLATRY